MKLDRISKPDIKDLKPLQVETEKPENGKIDLKESEKSEKNISGSFVDLLREKFGKLFDRKSIDFITTREERLSHCPKENSEKGDWEGERGESRFIIKDPAAKEICDEKGVPGVEYKNCVPDFTDYSEGEVKIDHMTSNRDRVFEDAFTGITTKSNFEQAREKFAEKFNEEKRDGKTDWTPKDIKNYLKDHQLTMHECSDRKTIQLIPTAIHDCCSHSGGVAECKALERQQSQTMERPVEFININPVHHSLNQSSMNLMKGEIPNDNAETSDPNLEL